MRGIRDHALTRRLLDLPIRRKLSCVVAVMAIDLAAVIAIGVFGMWALSSLRAYVGGESLWAKAQKNAIYSLSSYALSRDEKDWRAYEEHLKIPLGDRKARLELEKPRPDLRVSDAGFIEGGNHPEDARAMAHLFLRFQRVGYIRRAISLWREADTEIDALQAEAAELRRLVSAGSLSNREARRRLERIDAVNERLTRIESDFSYTLGEASRWARRVLFWTMAIGSLLFGGLGLLVALLVSASIADGVSALAEGAARAGAGDLAHRVRVETRDEIGLLADSFNRMSDGLAKLDRLKNDFIATASHELRTPLTLAMAPLESLLAGDAGDIPPAQRSLLEVAHNNAVRQLQLVNGLLDFSRLEAGRVEVKREPLDAAALTKSIVDDFRPLARGKGLELETRADIPSPVVGLDRYLYERIVFNLVPNAVKFTPRGGSVRVVLDQAGDRLRLAVTDTGVGIAKEDQGTLFRKFRQIDSSSTRRFEGTGLGLALVREFSRLLGGDASLRSAPGLGSEFSAEFSAPRAAEPAGAARAPGASPIQRHTPAPAARCAPEGPGGILLAEDNEELAAYLRGLLEELAPVRLARNGEEALVAARENPPDLVVSDVMMPRLDGLGLCRALKSDARTARVPVVLITALTDRESMTRGWKAGADEYLFKPFHPKEVVTRVRAMLRSSRQVAEIAAANEELKSFTYSVAHDLRAPLRNLDAFCEQLEKAMPPGAMTDDAREFMRLTRRSAARMDGILDGILQLSRAGRQDMSREDFPNSDAALAILTELHRAAPSRRVELAVTPGLRADADPALTRIVLRNLLENAWKFTSLRPAARIEFGVLERPGERVFFVRDDGAGFDMNAAKNMFAPFQRFHSPKDFPGSGIGLATVKRAVGRHGGRIWAESDGRGAAFYFTLAPAVTEAAAARPPSAA